MPLVEVTCNQRNTHTHTQSKGREEEEKWYKIVGSPSLAKLSLSLSL
jgi:hypothetical protein